jgi:hypothetical protein
VAWRPQSTRVIAWFGDARSNDPSLGHTQAATIAALRASGVRVIAIPVTGTPAPGLDELGQATGITSGTNGLLMPGQGPAQVADAIRNGIQALPVTVTPTPTCDPQLTLGASPANRTVRGGEVATFAETVTVRPSATPGTYGCTVDFQVEGQSVGYTQTVTVHVPGAQPALRISDVTVDEGDTGTIPATLTVTLDTPSTTTVTVAWQTQEGTATETDFVAGNGTLTFAPGETSTQLTVPITGDAAVEPDETFIVRLTNPTNATIADAEGTTTIRDDDDQSGGVPVLRIGDTTVPEASATGALTVSLDRPSTTTVTVAWATTPGTAGPGDYVEASGTLTLPAGTTTATVPVTITDDAVAEPTESFTVRLSAPTNATIEDAEGVVTILDEDGTTPGVRPKVRIGDATSPEGNAGDTPATFTVTLDKPSTSPVTVQWTTEPGTANTDDFATTTGELTFVPAEVSQQLTVALNADNIPEPAETFVVRLTSATGAVLADATGFGTITDDDTGSSPGEVPQLRIGDVIVPEGNSATTPATVTVVLDQRSETPVSVDWATEDGTAIAPADYTAGTGTLTFEPGATAKQVNISITGDRAVESAETFTIRLTGNDIADGEGTITVAGDDTEAGPVELSIADTATTEDAGTATFEIRLSEAAATTVTATWTTADGTAVAPADYTGGTGEVVLSPGQLTTLISVPVVADTTAEGEETFTVTLTEAAGATISDGEATATITDTGHPTGEFSCRASALELLGAKPAVAGATPCEDDNAEVAKVSLNVLGLLKVTAKGLTATTDAAPGGMSATAGLLTTKISTVGLAIELSAITSTATATCVAGPAGLTPTYSGSSRLADLKINGVKVPLGEGPVKIPLVVGTLSLNSTVATDEGVTQRAFDLRTLLGNVVIGESTVKATVNPC